MPPDLLSKRTRREFREHLVGWTLRTIEDLFDDQDIDCISVPDEYLPSGMRRSLVEQYYAGIRWGDANDVRKVLNVYEEILESIGADNLGEKARLERSLERDGYSIEQGRILPGRHASEFAVVLTASDRVDLAHLETYIERIKHGVESDPGLAIGSTKELLEATLKTILDESEISFSEKDDIPKLLRKTQKELALLPGETEEAKKGAKTIKRVLSAIGMVVVGVAQLRNLYGSGHGKAKGRGGVGPRHARLCVSLGAALCSFLLETFEARRSTKAF